MTKEQALKEVLATDGKFFSVEFIKKDGSYRKMNCRIGVKKGVKGTGMSYDPIKNGVLPVWDLQKDAFRMINLKTIKKINGKKVS